MDSLVLQTVIGLVFIFATGAAFVSVAAESISRYIGLRSEYLLRGLRTLLDGGGSFTLPFWEVVGGKLRGVRKATAEKDDADLQLHAAQEANRADPQDSQKTSDLKSATERAEVAAAALSRAQQASQLPVPPVGGQPAMVARIMAHPLVGVTAWSGQMVANAGDAPLTNRQRRQLPSYLTSRSFARTLIDILIPDASGQTTIDAVRKAISDGDLPPQLKSALLSLADATTTDVATFRANLEHWYDDEMARVSGWYKRHVRWISLGIGVIVVLVFNLNVLTIARSIYTDEAVRGAVVTQAAQASKCDKGPAECLQELRTNIADARGAGLPIGWTAVPACTAAGADCTWVEQRGLWVHGGDAGRQASELGLLLLGWAMMVLALLPGANFWFDILGRLGTLRVTGPKPEST